MKRPFSIRRDKLDADHLQGTIESPGYKLIEEKHLLMLQTLSKQLETETADVRYVQGQIHALRRVLELPKILTREIETHIQKTHAD